MILLYLTTRILMTPAWNIQILLSRPTYSSCVIWYYWSYVDFCCLANLLTDNHRDSNCGVVILCKIATIERFCIVSLLCSLLFSTRVLDIFSACPASSASGASPARSYIVHDATNFSTTSIDVRYTPSPFEDRVIYPYMDIC